VTQLASIQAIATNTTSHLHIPMIHISLAHQVTTTAHLIRDMVPLTIRITHHLTTTPAVYPAPMM